jgi:hypothetical protein
MKLLQLFFWTIVHSFDGIFWFYTHQSNTTKCITKYIHDGYVAILLCMFTLPFFQSKQQQHPIIKGQRFEPSLEGDNKDLYIYRYKLYISLSLLAKICIMFLLPMI